jgi:hypothetical protein
MSEILLRGKIIPLQKADNRVLLSARLCDLKFLKAKLEKGRLRGLVDQLYDDLDQAGLKQLRPTVYFGDEWFSPEGIPSIAVPFYLAHPRLMKLEHSMMNEVEGRTPAWFMKLIRHEAGHCFDHAYRVSQTKKWRQIFGNPERKYSPDVYLPNRHSKDFVRNLDGFYAQAHPDEDFAETFAVLVNPKSQWKKKYYNWPVALEKLNYVSELIRKYGERKPHLEDRPDFYNALRMRTTLSSLYQKRMKALKRVTKTVSSLAGNPHLSIV